MQVAMAGACIKRCFDEDIYKSQTFSSTEYGKKAQTTCLWGAANQRKAGLGQAVVRQKCVFCECLLGSITAVRSHFVFEGLHFWFAPEFFKFH